MIKEFSYKSLEPKELLRVAVLAANEGHGDDDGDGEKHPESYEFRIRKRLPGQSPYYKLKNSRRKQNFIDKQNLGLGFKN